MKPQLPRDPLHLSFGVALLIALTGNLAFFRAVLAVTAPGAPTSSSLVVVSGGILVLALSLILALCALPHLWKPVVITLLLVTAGCAHFMDSYGVVIDRSMIQNLFETDLAEARDLVTAGLLLRLLAFGVLPALLIARTPLRFGPWPRELLRRGALVVISVLVVGGAIASHYKQFALVGRSHGELRLLINPTSPLYAVWRYLEKRPEPTAIVAIGEDATRVERVGARPLLFVLVVGETARAANFSLGTYDRETNPRLDDLPIVYYPNVSSCGTSTAVSVPCMFSPFGRARYSDREAHSHEGLLDVVQRAGVSVLWRDNNSGCKGACDRVPKEAGSRLHSDAFCDGDECFDEVLLVGLRDWIDAQQGDGLVVLHQQGSHGPAYHKRSPTAFKKFLPECAGAAVERCSREEIVNAYDNTILYTDFVLSRLIGLLEQASDRFDVAMLYVSDHGESLGENGLYLHGLPWSIAPSEQTRVPMLMWLSEHFDTGRDIDRVCLAQRRHERRSHDSLFHSVLGLFDVKTQIYEPTLDLFRPCRAEPPPHGQPALKRIGTDAKPRTLVECTRSRRVSSIS